MVRKNTIEESIIGNLKLQNKVFKNKDVKLAQTPSSVSYKNKIILTVYF